MPPADCITRCPYPSQCEARKKVNPYEHLWTFSKVCMGIRNLMPEISMHHLVRAIRPCRFTKSLIKRPPKDMDELRTWATKFMQIEEHVDYHKVHQTETTSKESEKEKDRGNCPEPKQVDRFRENHNPHFHSYTPLTVPRGRIHKSNSSRPLNSHRSHETLIRPNIVSTIATTIIQRKDVNLGRTKLKNSSRRVTSKNLSK